MVTALLTLRLATGALSREEFGLWSFTTQSVGYFLLLDFGVSNSLGRLFAEPLASGNQKTINSWFTLAIAVLALQGLVILAAGLLLRDSVLEWFQIPIALREDAAKLWLAFLVIQAINLPLRVSSSILYAQNRAYLSNLFPLITCWVSLGGFYFMLNHGNGVMSYAWSSGIGVLIGGFAGAIALISGPNRFKISLIGVTSRQMKELFSYSSSVFVAAIAIQIVFSSQALVVTKILGLTAGAMYNVTSRLPLLGMQMLWRPFDAFGPRWQTAHCNDHHEQVASEFTVLFRLTLMAGVLGASYLMLINPLFVALWAKPEYYAGDAPNIFIGVFLVIQTLIHCFSFGFFLRKKLTVYTRVILVTTILAVLFMISGVKLIGCAGIPAGLIVADLVFGFWFYLIKGGQLLGVNARSLLLRDIGVCLATFFAAGALTLTSRHWLFGNTVAQLMRICGVAMVLGLPLLWRAWSVAKASFLFSKNANVESSAADIQSVLPGSIE